MCKVPDTEFDQKLICCGDNWILNAWGPLGAQSDSEVSSYHQSEVTLDRGYTSDSEVYTEHSKARMPRSATEVEVGWLVVSIEKHYPLLVLHSFYIIYNVDIHFSFEL